MKIPANQNLIPYFQPRRDAFPAGRPDGKYPAEPDPGTGSHDSLRSREQTLHRYYVDDKLTNRVYGTNRKVVSQSARTKGVLIDLYA